jgi:hypothetical protein
MLLRAARGLFSEPQHFVTCLVAAPKSLIDAPGTEDQGCNHAHPLGLLRGDYDELGGVEGAQDECWLRL